MSTDTTPLSLDSAAALLRAPEAAVTGGDNVASAEQPVEQAEEIENEAVEAPEGDQAEETETDAPADGQATEEVDEEAEEPASPAIDPPTSWNKADKELFASLPPEAQRVIAQREKARDAEVSRRLGEAAAESKAIAERQAAIEQDRQNIEALLMARLPQPPDDTLIDSNPVEYLKQQRRYEAEIAQIQQIVDANAQARQKAQAEEQRTLNEHRKAEEERLKELIPELTGPEGKKVASAIASYGKSLGYDDDTLGLANANDLLVLHKAMLWDNAQKAAKAAKAKTVPKVAAPGVGRSKAELAADQRKSALARLEKSGSIEDALAAMRA